jgi:transcriptional regulator with XRE-family HTH domain
MIPEEQISAGGALPAKGGSQMKAGTAQRRRIGDDSWDFEITFSGLLWLHAAIILVPATIYRSVLKTPLLRHKKSYLSNQLKQAENNRSEFAKRLRQLMDERDLTQRQVADAAGVTRASVIKWLKNSYPGSAELYRLSKALGMEMQWFFEVIPYVPIPEKQAAKMPSKDIPASAVAPEHRAGATFAMKAAAIPELRGDLLQMLEAEIQRRKRLTEKENFENLHGVKHTWENLLLELRQAVEPSGKVSELAEFLSKKTGRKVPLASVSRWLSDSREPGARIAMLMLQWVEREQVK